LNPIAEFPDSFSSIHVEGFSISLLSFSGTSFRCDRERDREHCRFDERTANAAATIAANARPPEPYRNKADRIVFAIEFIELKTASFAGLFVRMLIAKSWLDC